MARLPKGDLFLVWCLTHTDVCLNLPFILSVYLFSLFVCPFPKSKVCGGHFVICLASSYGEDTSRMVLYPIKYLDKRAHIKIRAVVRGPNRTVRIPADDIVAPLRLVEPEPNFALHRWQRARCVSPAVQQGTGPKINLCYLACRTNVLGREPQVILRSQQWIMVSLTSVMDHLQIDYPPFLQSSIGSCTSRTHHGDDVMIVTWMMIVTMMIVT